MGNKNPSRVNLETSVDFDAKLFLGEEAIDALELKKLLSEAEGLAFIKGKCTKKSWSTPLRSGQRVRSTP